MDATLVFMEDKLGQLENDVSLIKERNKCVEADKAWETSATRMLSILVLTYIFAAAVLYLLNVENFLLSALVPVLGYFLSTQSLPFIKKWWISNFHS